MIGNKVDLQEFSKSLPTSWYTCLCTLNVGMYLPLNLSWSAPNDVIEKSAFYFLILDCSCIIKRVVESSDSC